MTKIRKWAWSPTQVWNRRPGGYIWIDGRKFYYSADLFDYELDREKFRFADLEPVSDWYCLNGAKIIGWSFISGWSTQDERKVSMMGNGRARLLTVSKDLRAHHYLIFFPVHRASEHPEKFFGFEVPFNQVKARTWGGFVRIHSYRKPVALKRVDQMAEYVRGWNEFRAAGVELKNMRLYSWSRFGVDVLDFRDHRHYKGFVRCQHEYVETGGRYMFEHIYTCTHCGDSYVTDSSG